MTEFTGEVGAGRYVKKSFNSPSPRKTGLKIVNYFFLLYSCLLSQLQEGTIAHPGGKLLEQQSQLSSSVISSVLKEHYNKCIYNFYRNIEAFQIPSGSLDIMTV